MLVSAAVLGLADDVVPCVFFFFFFVFDAAGLIFSGAPRLRFGIHPVMRPFALATVRPVAFRGIGGASLDCWLGGFGFVMVIESQSEERY